METLLPAQLQDFYAVKSMPPEFAWGPHIDQGLSQGTIYQHLTPQDQYYRMATTQGGICDRVCLLSIYDDGSADITLTHFYPNSGYARGHASLIDDITAATPPEGIRFGCLLVGLPIRRFRHVKEYENLKKSVARYVSHAPDLIGVDDDLPKIDYPFDLVVERFVRDSIFVYRISVTNTDYVLEFTQAQARNAARRKPVTTVIDTPTL